ncbi:MAG: glycosyltransferase family 4 protein, partial [Candidatus Taylorbacteria bacterium]|nr:glycosyltransferase family 4 protein [Candidatus Taylorbacteria bacterium]
MTPQNKRILFIITQSEMGGAQGFLLNLLTRISNRYEILVATGSPRQSYAKAGSDGSNELGNKLKLLNIEIIKLENLKRNISPTNDIKACFEIRDLINKFKPDTLFLLSSKAGFIGSLASNFLTPNSYRPRIIYRIGGWTFNDPWPAWKKKLWVKLEKLSAPWKDVIIVNNQHDLEQAHKLGIKPREKIVLIHNGIDPYKLKFLPRDEARVKLELFEGVRYPSFKVPDPLTIIGTVANLYPAKGIKFLIETAEYFKNNSNTIFLVIGDGQEKPELEKMLKEKGLEKKVFLLGRLPDSHKLMSAFDIFVLPSVKEGFPWALIEAMAAKLPVIATRVGAVPEIIDNGKNGFIVEPANPAALAGKIKELLVNDHLLQEFSIQSHQTFLFNVSEDKMIK